MKRIAIAIAIAAGIYGLALAVGGIVYATDNVPTGPTHNECGDLLPVIAEREHDGDEEEVEQEELKQETLDCLAGEGLYVEEGTHFRTEEDVVREYIFWSIWPGVIVAVIFLIWPIWTKILLNQEDEDSRVEEDVPHKD
jgi:hypothetical protein